FRFANTSSIHVIFGVLSCSGIHLAIAGTSPYRSVARACGAVFQANAAIAMFSSTSSAYQAVSRVAASVSNRTTLPSVSYAGKVGSSMHVSHWDPTGHGDNPPGQRCSSSTHLLTSYHGSPAKAD